MPLLEARNIKKNFGGVPALVNGNLTCREGRITGLLGANGSGKSTLSKIITGVYFADSGEISFKDNPVQFKKPIDARRAGIAMAFQNLSLLPDLKVWQNIILNFEERKGIFLDNKSARRRAQELMDKFVEGFDIDRPVSRLDSGEKQMVEISKALAQNPQLLILDEPTAALEHAQVQVLFQYMKELTAQGVGIIFTSHRMNEVMSICDDVVVFRNGENVGEIDFAKDGKDPEKIIEMITGEGKGAMVVRSKSEITGEPMMKVHEINFGKSLKNISFDLHKGEILGIAGLQGQGQNVLMHALSGNLKGAGISCELDGETVRLSSPKKAIRHGIVLVPGDRQVEGLINEFSVLENFIVPKQSQRHNPFLVPKRRYGSEVEGIVDKLSIKTAGIGQVVNKLSGGNQQKVVFGKWLPFDIKVLILADPAKGVDVGAKKDLYDFVEKMADEQGVSVVLYASENEELSEHCDRVLVMYEGRIVRELTDSEISEEEITSASLMGGKNLEAGQ